MSRGSFTRFRDSKDRAKRSGVPANSGKSLGMSGLQELPSGGAGGDRACGCVAACNGFGRTSTPWAPWPFSSRLVRTTAAVPAPARRTPSRRRRAVHAGGRAGPHDRRRLAEQRAGRSTARGNSAPRPPRVPLRATMNSASAASPSCPSPRPANAPSPTAGSPVPAATRAPPRAALPAFPPSTRPSPPCSPSTVRRGRPGAETRTAGRRRCASKPARSLVGRASTGSRPPT